MMKDVDKTHRDGRLRLVHHRPAHLHGVGSTGARAHRRFRRLHQPAPLRAATATTTRPIIWRVDQLHRPADRGNGRAPVATFRPGGAASKRPYLCFDEWNVWYKNRQMDGEGKLAPHLIEEVYNLEDALIVAGFLNSFIRHADVLKIANIAQIVNVIAPILTRGDDLLIQSIFYPFEMFAKRRDGVALRGAGAGPGVRGEVKRPGTLSRCQRDPGCCRRRSARLRHQSVDRQRRPRAGEPGRWQHRRPCERRAAHRPERAGRQQLRAAGSGLRAGRSWMCGSPTVAPASSCRRCRWPC